MFDNLVLYSMQHPATVILAGIGMVIILVWMTGSGSRQRFVVFKRTKETEQMARDLSRIAAALERLAKAQEQPTDFVGRPIPHGYEQTILTNHVLAEEHLDETALGQRTAEEFRQETVASPANDARAAAAHAGAVNAGNSAPQNPPANLNPLAGTANMLGKKKPLDLPNPFFRSK